MKETTPPWPGLILAVFGAGSVIFVSGDFWLGLAVLVVWTASLYLSLPRPEGDVAPRDEEIIDPGKMRELIEPLSMPYLGMENGRITLANRAAREVLGAHIVGQDARVALRHPQAIELLDKPGGGEAVIRGLISPRSIWHMSKRPIDARTTMIELVNRTAEADISRAHTDFVANASHELRTPLASIIGYVETLIEESDKGPNPMKPQTPTRFLEIISKEAKRLQALVEDLMSLSRIEAEKHDLPPTVFDIGTVCESVVSEMTAIHGKSRIVIDRAADPMPIRGDRQQIDQLLRNLIENAIKYGAEDAPVNVAVAPHGNGFLLTVQDRGEGIAPEHLPHLTRRFYRTDPGRSRAVGGRGLGLAIVKHIVERHRGRLDISSRLGEGTTVSIRLPRHEPEHGTTTG